MAVSFQIGCYFGNVFFDSHLKSFHHVLNKLQIQLNFQISGWYRGCFKENIQDRVFNVSAGNYQVHDTSAQKCTSACAFLSQSYAARNGDLCLCGSGSYNKYGLASSESLCDGMHSQQIPYNATTYIRVYSTQKATGGLKIHGPEVGWLFQETKFTVVVGQGMKALLPIVNSLHSFVLNLDLLYACNIFSPLFSGDFNSTFTFDFGDGSFLITTCHNASHIFFRLGHFHVKVSAHNNVSGPIIASTWISIRSVPGKVDFDCPKTVATENETQIGLKVSHGTEMEATVSVTCITCIALPQTNQKIFDLSGE